MIIRLIGPRRSSLATLMLATGNTVRDTGVQSVMMLTSGNGESQLRPDAAVVMVFVDQSTTTKDSPGRSQVRPSLDTEAHIANARRSVCACKARFSWETTQSGTTESKPLNVAATTCNSVWT